MSLGEFRYWLAHGGSQEYARWREAWALEAQADADRAAAAQRDAGRPGRAGFRRMPLQA